MYIDGDQALGFYMNAMVYTSATDMPWELPDMFTFGLRENPEYQGYYSSSGANKSTLEWLEMAASYSRKVYDRYNHRFDADIAYSLPINYDKPINSSSFFDKSMVRGKGIAFDIGVTYLYKKIL